MLGNNFSFRSNVLVATSSSMLVYKYIYNLAKSFSNSLASKLNNLVAISYYSMYRRRAGLSNHVASSMVSMSKHSFTQITKSPSTVSVAEILVNMSTYQINQLTKFPTTVFGATSLVSMPTYSYNQLTMYHTTVLLGISEANLRKDHDIDDVQIQDYDHGE